MSSSLEPRVEYYPRFYDFTYQYGGYGYSLLGEAGNPAFKAIDSHHINVSGDRKTPNPFGFHIYKYTPLKGEREDWSCSYGVPKSVSRYIGEGMCQIVTHLCDEGQIVPAVTNRCLTKVIDEIKNSDLNLATSIGEGRETIGLLNSITKSAIRSIAHISKSAASRDWRRRVRLMGGTVLFANLALKPLLADIEALRQHVLSSDKMRQGRLIEKKSGKQISLKEIKHDTSDGVSSTHTETLVMSARCRISCYVEINDLHQFESWRAGLLVRPSLAWELTTLSFLVDYFIDIGRMIEQYEATVMYNGFSVSDVCTTITTRSTRDVTISDYRTDRSEEFNGFKTMNSFNHYTIETKTLDRSVGALPPVPPPLIKVPRSSTQLLNIAGLLTNLFKLSNRG